MMSHTGHENYWGVQGLNSHNSFLDDLYATDVLPILPLQSEADMAAFLLPCSKPVNNQTQDHSNVQINHSNKVPLEINSNIVGGDMSDLQLLSPNLRSMSIPELKFDDISQTFSDTGNSSSGIFSEESNHDDGHLWNIADEVCRPPSGDSNYFDGFVTSGTDSSMAMNQLDSNDNITESAGDKTPVNNSAKPPRSQMYISAGEVIGRSNQSEHTGGNDLTFYDLSPISNASSSSSALDESDTTTTGSPTSSSGSPTAGDTRSRTSESPTGGDKPPGSYISLLAKAILGSAEQRMVLGDIYDHFLDIYPFFRNTKCSWRNSIRHNLSVNECFVKDGRAKNGKGFFWAIHSACIGDFTKGDYDRRTARKRVMLTNKTLAASIKKSVPQSQQLRVQQSQIMQIHQLPQSVSNCQLTGGGVMRNYVSNDMRVHPYYHGVASGSRSRQLIQPEMALPAIKPYNTNQQLSLNASIYNRSNSQGYVFY
jgi:hypothetical protein